MYRIPQSFRVHIIQILQCGREISAILLRGAMGGNSVILVKDHFFILLNKSNLHTIIYSSLKFPTSITVVPLFVRSYVNFCAI